MSFTAKFPNSHIQIADDPANIVFGTAMIGDTFGAVISATIKRDGQLEEITKHANLLTAIITNPNFELTLNTVFTAEVDPPGLAELIVFPMAGISGRIMPGIEIAWEESGHRGLSITAKSWDSLTVNDGAGNASAYDLGTGALTPIL